MSRDKALDIAWVIVGVLAIASVIKFVLDFSARLDVNWLSISIAAGLGGCAGLVPSLLFVRKRLSGQGITQVRTMLCLAGIVFLKLWPGDKSVPELGFFISVLVLAIGHFKFRRLERTARQPTAGK